MPKFTIYWNLGFGENRKVIEADDAEQAALIAREEAEEDFERRVTWRAEPAQKKKPAPTR